MPDVGLIGPVAPPELHVMTYNVRRPVPHLDRHSPDRWEARRPLLTALLGRERPTLLGTQELMPEQAGAVLEGLGPDYRSIGHGRDADGGDESNAIYWDSSRLRLIDEHQQALSDTPAVPGSRTWGNPWSRILVWTAFEDLATGIEFLFVNTHLDPVSRRSRLRSAEVLNDLVSANARPAVVTGDMNTGPRSATHRILTGTTLRDLWTTAPHKLSAEWGTFPNYRKPKAGGARIDWILGTAGIEVLRAGINTAHEAGWPSDHAPMQAVIRVTAR